MPNCIFYFRPSLISPLKLDSTSVADNAISLDASPSWLSVFFALLRLIMPLEIFATSDAVFFIFSEVVFNKSVILFGVGVFSYPYWK